MEDAVSLALMCLAATIAAASVVHAVRAWRRGERAPVRVAAIVCGSLLVVFGALFLLYAANDQTSPN